MRRPTRDRVPSQDPGFAEFSLDRSLESAALEAAANAILIANADGVIIWVNMAFTELTGHERDDALGKSTRILKSGRHPPEFYGEMWRTIKSGNVWRGEIVNRHKDGHSYTEEMTITPVRDAEGTIEHFVAIKQDVSERKKRERLLRVRTAELEKSNDDLQHFAYIVSHDLREPLRMVSSYLGLLEAEYGDIFPDEAREYIQYAVDGASRMGGCIDALLVYSRVGSHGERFLPIDTGAVVKDAIANLDVAIRENTATVNFTELPQVLGDRSQLTQVFQNLIGNAIKFRNDTPPTVVVQSQRADDNWHFSVADNGIGIAPRHADRIFKAFQRLHLPEEYPGTGMGLAITKKIVERHGGRIWVESEPGDGSVFHFTVPYAGE